MTAMKILFCNIAWMKWYKGYRYNDIPENGGSYVKKTKQGAENDNFWPIVNTYPTIMWDDGTELSLPQGDICMGFVETGHTKGESNQLHIENIQDCSGYKNAPYVEDVLVIFCATRTGDKHPVVVGWYNHAIVLRNYVEYGMEDGSVLWKNIICKAEDAVLMPVNERKWHVPRATPRVTREKYGFGRSNIWYADYNQSEKVKPWVEDIYDKITKYDGENILYEEIVSARK